MRWQVRGGLCPLIKLMFCFLKDVGCGNNVVAGNPVYNHPKQHTFVNSPYFIYLWVFFFLQWGLTM